MIPVKSALENETLLKYIPYIKYDITKTRWATFSESLQPEQYSKLLECFFYLTPSLIISFFENDFPNFYILHSRPKNVFAVILNCLQPVAYAVKSSIQQQKPKTVCSNPTSPCKTTGIIKNNTHLSGLLNYQSYITNEATKSSWMTFCKSPKITAGDQEILLHTLQGENINNVQKMLNSVFSDIWGKSSNNPPEVLGNIILHFS